MGSPPNIGGAVTGSVTEDSNALITGQLTETANIWANTWSIQSGALFGTVSINPTTGLWTYDLDDTNAVVNALDGGDTLTDTFVVRVTDSNGNDTQTITITINGVTCFAADTLIETEDGPRRAIDLSPGDRVMTLDHGLQVVRWVGARHVSHAEMIAMPSLQPVTFAAGSLGGGMPVRDLTVSRQHRIRLMLPLAELMIDATDLLVTAAALTVLPGVQLALPAQGVTYVHLLLDRHELLHSEGVVSESFFPGTQAMAMLSADDRAEVEAILADQGAMQPARPLLQGSASRVIVDAFRRQVLAEGSGGAKPDLATSNPAAHAPGNRRRLA